MDYEKGLLIVGILCLITPLVSADYSESDLCENTGSDYCILVSPSGSDSSSCGSFSSPCRTLDPVIPRIFDHSSTVKTVVMKGGDYGHGHSLTLYGSNIVIKNWPGETPRIWRPHDVGLNQWTFKVSGTPTQWSRNIIVDGLDLEGAFLVVKLDPYVQGITFRNNKIHGAGLDNIKITGCPYFDNHLAYDNYLCTRDILFEFNEIYDSSLEYPVTYDNEGIDANAVYNVTVRNNYFHNIGGTAMYAKGNSRLITIENNYVFDSHAGWTKSTSQANGGGLRLGGYMQEWFVPEPPHKYEAWDSVMRNNIIVKIGEESNGIAITACDNCSAYQNTVFNYDRVEYDGGESNWINRFSGSMMMYWARTLNPPSHYDLQRRLIRPVFKNNLIVDVLDESSKDYIMPIVSLYGTFFSGTNDMHAKLRENVYYGRNTGEFRFRNQEPETGSHDYLDFAQYQSESGLDQDSFVATDGTTLLRYFSSSKIADDRDPRNYLPVAGSEAYDNNAGARIDFSVYPWTRWFPETCSGTGSESCTTSYGCTGTRTCDDGLWGTCTDNNPSDGCPASCSDNDNDGYGNPASTGCTFSGLDCNDNNPAINPGAFEICENGIDDDCAKGDSTCPICRQGNGDWTQAYYNEAEASLYGFIYPEGCECFGTNYYTGYCCTDGYNGYQPCGLETCKPNSACITKDNCPGTCNSLGTVCLDSDNGDRCPAYVLQEGVNGYYGVKDARIRSNAPTTTEGTTEDLQVGTNDIEDKYKTLLQFDLSPIPMGATIDDCLLQLPITGEVTPYWRDPVEERFKYASIRVYRLNQPWAESEVTYNNRDANTPWQSPGAEGSDDRYATPMLDINPWYNPTITPPMSMEDVSADVYMLKQTWVNINLSAGSNICQGWINGDYANNGILLETYQYNSDYSKYYTGYVNYASKEDYPIAGFTPRLIINLDVEGYPELSSAQCNIEGIWQNCNASFYGSTMTGFRATCGDPDGAVNNVRFALYHVGTDSIRAAGAGTKSGSNIWQYDFSQITLDNSGDYVLSINCTDNEGKLRVLRETWSLPWGVLSTQNVNTPMNVNPGNAFTYSTKVICTGGDCSSVIAIIDPIFGNDNYEGFVEYYPAISDGTTLAGRYRMNGEVGALQSMTVSMYRPGTGETYHGALYFDDNGQPGRKYADAVSYEDYDDVWFTFYFDNERLEPNTYYWFAVGISGGTNRLYGSVNPDQQSTTVYGTGIPPDSNTFGTITTTQSSSRVMFGTYNVVDPHYKGIIPMNAGSPFYTTTQNPATYTTFNCLQDMKGGDECTTSWNVVTTADSGQYNFFVSYEPESTGVNNIDSTKVLINVSDCFSSCNNPADTDCNDMIDIGEVSSAINSFYAGSLSLTDLVEALKKWKAGFC